MALVDQSDNFVTSNVYGTPGFTSLSAGVGRRAQAGHSTVAPATATIDNGLPRTRQRRRLGCMGDNATLRRLNAGG